MAAATRKAKHSPFSAKARSQLKYVKECYGWFRRWWHPDGYRLVLMKVYRANARDFRLSQKLAAALVPLQRVNPISIPVVDAGIGGDWRPFRVERGLTASMRGEICSGRFTGTLTSNMLDSSSVLFLENKDGETMRVMLPSPVTSAEMLAQALDDWRANTGYVNEYWESSWERDRDTHVSSVIHNFARSKSWTNVLVHPEIIDVIDASCMKPEDLRPVIRIQGTLIQKGVALATAITVNGDQRIFVPTGFFKQLTGAVQKYLPNLQEPKLMAA